MTTDDDFDRQIQAYLESGPAELADRVLWAARAQLKTTRRRRPGFAWLAPWRNPNMTRNSRLLVGGGALVVAIGAGLVGSMFAQPNPGPAASAAQSAAILGDAIRTELLGGARPELVQRCSEGAGVVRHRGDGRGSERPHSHAAARRQGARGRGQDRPKPMAVSDLGRAVRPEHRHLERRPGACTAPATATPRRCCQMAGCWWPAARGGEDGWPPPSCTTRSAGPGLPPGTCSRPAEVIPPRCSPMARCSLWAATATRRIAELYDPASGTWTATGRPRIRYHVEHTATLLPDGRVLVAGGPPNGRDDGWPTAELYDPSSGSWTVTGNMVRVRLGHTATLLPDGQGARGGRRTSEGNSKSTASAELYDPSSGSWTATGNMVAIRIGGLHGDAAADGRVLVVGGFRSGGNGVLASAELYDPGTGTWTAAPNMDTPLANQTATLLPDGRVLVAGGMSVIDGTARPLASAELYDPGVGN